MKIKAINTRYKGYNFRSRTEARWAVFFDEIGWDWQYEAEGYKLPSGNYLPDFYFPKINTYAEVKAKEFSAEELQKCKELSKISFINCLKEVEFVEVIMLDGPPSPKSYNMFKGGEECSDVIFIPVGDKYYPLYYSYDFDPDYFESTFDAIHIALSKRFEFNDRER